MAPSCVGRFLGIQDRSEMEVGFMELSLFHADSVKISCNDNLGVFIYQKNSPEYQFKSLENHNCLFSVIWWNVDRDVVEEGPFVHDSSPEEIRV